MSAARSPGGCFFVPPHVLERIALTGTAEQRELAIRTLAIDHSIRALRLQNARLAGTLSDRAALYAPERPGQPERIVADARGGNDAAAAEVVRREGDPPVPDVAVNEVYEGFGATFDLWWQAYRRSSIDGRGMPLRGVVHYGRSFDNAFWDGEQMIFGDGDGQSLTHFTGAVEVIGHELAHGVTQHTCGLHYVGQPGALNESLSDVFGSLVKQHRLRQTADAADWLVGEGVLGPLLPGRALRSMAAPGTAFEYDDQPATMSAYLRTDQDNGGVHLNSGIPNHAFWLAATAIGGFAWEKAGRIWYEAMRDPRLAPTARFHEFAMVTVSVAERTYGAGSVEAGAVLEAWQRVEVV